MVGEPVGADEGTVLGAKLSVGELLGNSLGATSPWLVGSALGVVLGAGLVVGNVLGAGL